MAIVCLDTPVISLAVLPHPQVDDERKIPLAKDFVKWLDETEDVNIILPTTVVAELFVVVPPDEQPATLKAFSSWAIVEFDLKAALIYADIRRRFIQARKGGEINRADYNKTRNEINADTIILATAIAHGAESLYTFDDGFVAWATDIASDHITVQHVEDQNFQRQLPNIEGDDI